MIAGVDSFRSLRNTFTGVGGPQVLRILIVKGDEWDMAAGNEPSCGDSEVYPQGDKAETQTPRAYPPNHSVIGGNRE